jgi:hypothetical protein
MAIDNEAIRIAQEESPGPSELESALLQDSLKEIELDPALAMDETSSIHEAVRMMRQHRQPCMPVVWTGDIGNRYARTWVKHFRR